MEKVTHLEKQKTKALEIAKNYTEFSGRHKSFQKEILKFAEEYHQEKVKNFILQMDLDLVDKYIIGGDKYIKLQDYCSVFGKHERTVRQYIEKGNLKSKKIKNRVLVRIQYLILMDDIMTLLKCHSDETEWIYFQFLVYGGYQYTREGDEIEITEYYNHVSDFAISLN